MTINVAVFGAAGSMGTRGRAMPVKPGCERGIDATSQEEAVRDADAAIFAVPDKEIVPSLESKTVVITLDPAAVYGGRCRRGRASATS
jgi:hypothetical protein